jgi:hypothetical protein
MGKVIIYTADGEVTIEENASPPSLDELQTLVDGYIELLTWPTHNVQFDDEPAQFYVNEEGLIRGLPVNEKGSALAAVDLWNMGRPLVGTVVVLTGDACCE